MDIIQPWVDEGAQRSCLSFVHAARPSALVLLLHVVRLRWASLETSCFIQLHRCADATASTWLQPARWISMPVTQQPTRLGIETSTKRFHFVRCKSVSAYQNSIEIKDGNKIIEPHEIGIENVNLQDGANAYAYHIPEGIIIHYNPANLSQSNISLKRTSIAHQIDTYGDCDWTNDRLLGKASNPNTIRKVAHIL